MRNVERVNSMGVHRWIPLISKFSAKHQAAFDEISYALVQNANVVANLFGKPFLPAAGHGHNQFRDSVEVTFRDTPGRLPVIVIHQGDTAGDHLTLKSIRYRVHRSKEFEVIIRHIMPQDVFRFCQDFLEYRFKE